MQKQGSTSPPTGPRPPWSPFAVSLIAFVLPPGGAVLAVQSMGRMRDKPDSKQDLRAIIATTSVFAAGLAILLLVAEAKGGQPTSVSPGVSSLISIGTALACYWVLRPAYATWRSAHPTVRPSSWLSGIGIAILFSLITIVGSVILHGIAIGVGLLLGLAGNGP